MAGGRWFCWAGQWAIVSCWPRGFFFYRCRCVAYSLAIDLAPTFPGRTSYAHHPADIASGEFPETKLTAIAKLNVEFDSGDLPRVIYIDHFGNAWAGVRDVPKIAW